MHTDSATTLDWLASQGLDFSDLQAFTLIDRRAGTITPWAAFTRELRLTESQAKTRAAHLERAGLCVREVVEDPTRKGPKEVGSRYTVTALGRQLLERVARAWPEAVGRRAAAGQGRPALQSVPAIAPRAVVPQAAPAPAPIRPVDLSRLHARDRATLDKLPFRLRGLVRAALQAGEALDDDRLAVMQLDAAQRQSLREMVAEIRGRAGQGASEPAAIALSASAALEAIAPLPPSRAEEATLVPAATTDATLATPATPHAEPYAQLADLVLAEVKARPAAQRLRESRKALTDVLPEIVWSCVHGCLADYGPPLKRVRTALRLIAEGRWSRPKGMGPAFAGDFRRLVAVAA